MNEYIEMNHMIKITNNKFKCADNQSYYFPQHAVLKESSTTTKLRVVFNGSKKTTSGLSLNDISLVGPTIQKDIWTLLIEFRKHEIAYTADIAKMYRQILVNTSDTPYQRILWRNTPQDQIEEFELLTVTYGTASAPYLAVKVLHQLADDESEKIKIGSKILKSNFYVDDFIRSSSSVHEALAEKQEVTELLKQGGFSLRKWSSNSEDFLNTIDAADKEKIPISIQEDSSIKTLGLQWQPNSDFFVFKVRLDNITYFTKRIVLSEVSRIYDPLGLLGPIITYAKVILQQIWVNGNDWDSPLPAAIHEKYKNFRKDLLTLSTLKIQRWLCIQPKSEIHLIGFCDASEVAYSAVVYVRTKTNNKINLQLIASKTKVAPIKQISLPRLELCGASLLTKLMMKIIEGLQMSSRNVICFTDSTIVLAWLQEIPRKWKSFIANRTSYIITNIPSQHWQHVKSAENPADAASRGILASQIHSLNLWWHGPNFLYDIKFNTSNNLTIEYNTELEKRSSSIFIVNIENKNEHQDNDIFNGIVDKYSSLFKLQRVTARCLRFIKNCRSQCIPSNKNQANLSVTELQEATNLLIKSQQNTACAFKEEISLLLKKKPLPNHSKILTLNPFVDNEGILRVGGRIQQSKLSYGRKHPIILSGKGQFSKLIIEDIHKRYFHAGQQLMLSVISMKFWLISGKNQVRKCIRDCVVRMRHRNKFYNQQMGQLPAYRLSPSRPFTNTGTDFAGPYNIRSWHGRGAKILKSYLAIFVCMSTKALHLELVIDLTTEALMAAIHRFISRRGVCKNMYSDNGRNYTGAARQLKEIQYFLQQNHQIISIELCKNQIELHFIPAYAPHFGGIWESAVKSVKFHIKRVIGETHLTFEQMSTLLCQFEASLNSRPIAPKSDDIDDLEL